MTGAWVKRWGDELAAEPEAPGVWRRKAGGFRVRGRVTDPRTGKLREVNRALPDVRKAREASAMLAAELARVTAGEAEARGALPHFADWAATVFERKIGEGRILSAAGREKWAVILRAHLVPAFGAIYVDKLSAADVEAWKVAAGQRIRAGKMSPSTGNTILSVLRVITAAAADAFDVPDPCRKVRPFDTRGHQTYPEEAPNSIAPADVPRFLSAMRRLFPQHFAFVFLGLTTGLRPSSLRPLRVTGRDADVKWDEGVLLVRRSHTRGSEIMAATKTGRDQRLTLPPELLAVLRWHVESLPAGPMRESGLLFPARDGSLRSTWNLRKAFAAVRTDLGLAYPISPRAMRRTFQDLAREAGVADVVTRAISGHATESMQRRYSTARSHEVTAGLARVIDIATARRLPEVASGGDAGGDAAPVAAEAG